MSFKKKFLTLSAITAGTLSALHIFNRFIYHISTIDNILAKNGENYYDWTYGRIFYTKEGSGSPILLVHDLNVCSSSYEWNKIKNDLAKTNTVYIIDLLGCGLSEKPNLTYTNYLYVQLLTDFIKNVIGEKTDIITTGHSASIALMTCANDDTVIDRILLINPESIIDASKTPKHYNKVLKYILCTPIIGTFIYNLLVSKDRIEENFMTDYFYDHCKFKKRDLAAYVEASQSEKSHGRYLYANICSNFTNTNVLNCLSKIDNSIFIIVGNGNPEYSLAASQYQNQLPAIEICEIEKTKYLPQLEAPTDVLENIKIYFDLTA